MKKTSTFTIPYLVCLIALLLMVNSLFAQEVTKEKVLKGIVTDGATNEPLVGANILVPSTSIGTVTDIDGKFELKVPETATELEFRFIGYQAQTITIGDKSSFDIKLSAGELLEDVIIIGYGTQKKSDKTGAVASVTAEELNKGRLSDPIQSMQGKAAGVIVSKQGGDPNEGFSVNIRGAAGLTTGTGPLYVVDGVPGVDPTTLNPDDIASFNVLKDASSTAIYGSRGANGVVIITTKGAGIKQGEEVKQSSVEYSGFVSFDNVARKLNFLSADQVRNFTAQNPDFTFIDEGGNVDWQDEIFRQGISHAHTVAFAGADRNSSYRASLSSNNLLGIIEGSGKDRYIGRLNLTQKGLNGRLTLQARMSATIEENEYITYGDGITPNNVLYQAYRRNPTDPVFNADGSYFETDKSFQYFNPIAIINDFQNNRKAKRLLGNFRADLEIFKGLIGSVNFAYIRDDDENYYFEPSFTASNTTNGLGRREYDNFESSLVESTLNYNTKLNEVHSLNIIGGHSYQINNEDGFKAQGENAQSDLLLSHNLGTLLDLEYGSISSYEKQSLLASFFGRVVYDFDKKYFLTATIRRDGSSKFGSNNEWGWFPSASAGWNLKREAFLADNPLISQLKLRVGYGITGNQEIDPYLDNVYFIPTGTTIDPETGDPVISFGNDGDINANPDLKWEENAELNLGLDFGLFKDKISGSIEFYQKRTYDLIYKYELPVPPNKNRFIYANAGEIKNTGLEATIQAYLVDKSNLNWKSILTFATNSQETVRLSNDLYDLDEIRTLFVSGRGLVGGENWTQIIQPGLEIGTFYMPEYAGLSEDGKFLFHTAAGGVSRDLEKAERRVVGSAQPDFTLGWSNYLTLGKSLDLSFALRSVIGHDILNVTRMVFSNPADLPTLNVLEEALEEFDRGLTSAPVVSSYYLEKGDFLKLDNFSIGYNFNNKNSLIFKNLRLYLTGTNLFVLTNYTGVDPELNYGGFEFGLDQYDVYPKTRSFTVGVNATF